VCQIYEGSSDVQKILIQRALSGCHDLTQTTKSGSALPAVAAPLNLIAGETDAAHYRTRYCPHRFGRASG
jgi:hypothetical protein